MKLLRLTLCVLALLLLTSSNLAEAETKPPGGMGGVVIGSRGQTGTSFRYELLNQKVALWSDGRGDVILERRYKTSTFLPGIVPPGISTGTPAFTPTSGPGIQPAP